MIEEKTDNQLMEDFFKCSIAAYNILVQRYKARLFNYVLRSLIHDRDGSEDIVQKTLIRLYEYKYKYKASYQFSTWIFTVARNFSIDEMRRKKAVYFQDDEIEIMAKGETPVSEMENNERKEMLLKAINSLKPKYKEIIIARYLECMPYEEISEITKINLNTLKSLSKRGLEQLKNKLRN